MWVLRVELRLSGLMQSSFTHLVILPTPETFYGLLFRFDFCFTVDWMLAPLPSKFPCISTDKIVFGMEYSEQSLHHQDRAPTMGQCSCKRRQEMVSFLPLPSTRWRCNVKTEMWLESKTSKTIEVLISWTQVSLWTTLVLHYSSHH